MFTIDEVQTKYKVYELRDESGSSWIKVAPERGGIITEFGVHGDNVLFMDEATFNDPATNVRGGIPVLFPICGQLANDQYQWNGKKYKIKPHGFARNLPWKVIRPENQEQAAITIELTQNETTREMYPFDFLLRFTYRLKGNQLTIDQEYHNHSDVMMPIYAGFHPYFKVGKKQNLVYESDGTIYLDYADLKIKPFSQTIDLSRVSIAKLILNQAKNKIVLHDPTLKHKISLTYSKEFKYPLLWTTEGKDFMCVEPFMAKMNALNTHEDLTLIKPGGVIRIGLTITVDPLP